MLSMALSFLFAPSLQSSPIKGEEIILGNIYHIVTFPPQAEGIEESEKEIINSVGFTQYFTVETQYLASP